MSIIEKLNNMGSKDENLVYKAIVYLDTEKEIKKFYSEYVTFLKGSENEEVRSDPKYFARSNIVTMVHHCGPETYNKWFNALPK